MMLRKLVWVSGVCLGALVSACGGDDASGTSGSAGSDAGGSDASDPRYATLASILADDRLYVLSTVGECGVYLGLEGEIGGALEPGEGKCGGRSPDDDVIERSYSVLAAGLLAGVDDTITENDKANSDAFPFLARPH